MNSYEERLNCEIEVIVDARERRSEVLEARWITHTVCLGHESVLREDGEDREFWLWCGYKTVREMTRRYLARRHCEDPKSVSSKKEPFLPGFERLQAYYAVVREKEELFVPITLLADAEIDGKIAQYRAMGVGCHAHADELERFKELPERRSIAS